MDLGDMKSRDLGNLTSKGLVEKGKEVLEAQNQIPGTVNEQNVGHNAKKESMGPNTKR